MSDHEERVDQAISITERHPNKAKILPTITDSSDDNSPVLNKTFDDENSDSASSTSSSSSDDDDSNTVGIIATEAQRKRRIRCFMVLSFLPFVAAFLATGGFIAMRQNSNEDAMKLSEDGGKSSGATATEATSFSMLRTSSPTPSPHAAKQQYGPKQQLDYDSTASSDDGMPFIAKATTATSATTAAATTTTTTTTTATATTPITISTSDNTVEETTHGNLRSTMSPTPALTKVTTTSPTTASPTTASPTTASPTTASPTTASPTTASPTTAPTTASPTTALPITASPITASPTTASPTTASPITASPTTASPTTASPTTASPTTASPTTASPTTAPPTTASPTTASPTTASPTTASPTTAPTTASPTTASPTTLSPTTASPTTVPPTTTRPTTSFPVVVSMNLVDIGNDGEPWADFPLGECQGDCDGDDECEGSLVCFSRSNDEPVPGCNGDGTTGTDYCFQRPSTNYLYSPLDKFPLGLCEGDCDDDDDCEGDLICEQRSGFDEITGCVGRGAENDDYCRVATEETPVTPFPSTVESTACVSSGEYCSEDGNACCSGKCKKDKDTGEEVCVDEEGPEVTDNLRATISPTVAPVTSSPTCVRGGELCPDDKNMCCSGKCEKDKDTKQKVCTSDLVEASFEIGMDLCSAAGEPCTDKNMCCSGECKKADKKAERGNDIGQERKKDDNVCG